MPPVLIKLSFIDSPKNEDLTRNSLGRFCIDLENVH